MTVDDRASGSRVVCSVTKCDTTVDTNAMRFSSRRLERSSNGFLCVAKWRRGWGRRVKRSISSKATTVFPQVRLASASWVYEVALIATDPMTTWSAERALTCADLDGYVLKSDSPSCGLPDVRVHGSAGVARSRHFLSRVFAYRRRRLAIPNPEPRIPNP